MGNCVENYDDEMMKGHVIANHLTGTLAHGKIKVPGSSQVMCCVVFFLTKQVIEVSILLTEDLPNKGERRPPLNQRYRASRRKRKFELTQTDGVK